ncbi:hypothetical protein [Actinomadura chokoriensis]|uniref:Precorrin-6Y C5,15-methyltransferase (Decarboxylating) n=1 Tax=Actinomadura chokoriensis TaxID=454156 RepID=A0ABV4QW82_9ACTN
MPADAFGDGHGLRPDVRAFVLAKLGPGIGDMVWDVESGDGSVGIECARFGAAVVAVDRDYAACERVRQNVRLHGVKVAMASGDVRSSAGHLPRPDAVFLGQGGPEAIRACAALKPARIVAVAAPADAQAILDILDEQGYRPDAVRLQATRLGPPEQPNPPEPSERSGDPVIIVWGERDARPLVRRPSGTNRPIETISPPPGEPGIPTRLDVSHRKA